MKMTTGPAQRSWLWGTVTPQLPWSPLVTHGRVRPACTLPDVGEDVGHRFGLTVSQQIQHTQPLIY